MLPIEDSKAAAREAGVLEQFAELSVFRVLLRQPYLAKAFQSLLLTLLRGEHLPARLRELVIMRIGWATRSDYEWTQHWRIALGAGVDEADLIALRGDWRAHAGFDAADRAVLAATDETLELGTISARTWAECEKAIGSHAALLELVASIGNWRLFSSMLRSLEIPLEDGVESWPPDGKPPGGSGASSEASVSPPG
jgi:alkylhydroperoxidase family enzyme